MFLSVFVCVCVCVLNVGGCVYICECVGVFCVCRSLSPYLCSKKEDGSTQNLVIGNGNVFEVGACIQRNYILHECSWACYTMSFLNCNVQTVRACP